MSYSVILNGCNSEIKEATFSLRDRLRIDDKDFVFVFVGNINPNKNQKQVVDAFELLPCNVMKTTRVVFVGGGDVGTLVSYINEKGLDKYLHVVGPVPKEEIHNYYIGSNATILTSLSEGFGLSIVEGYIYGKPTVTFCDLGAFNDICIDDTAIGVDNRSNQALSDGMYTCICKDWDSKLIANFGQKFGYNTMKSDYIKLYRNILLK